MVLVVDLLDDEIGNDVGVVAGGVLQARFGIEPGELVGGALHLVRRETEAFAEIAPAMGDEILERVLHQAIDERIGALLVLELQHQAFTQVSRADAGWIELLDDAQDGLGLRGRIGRDVQVDLRFRLVLLQQLIRAFHDLLEIGLQVPVFADVAEELLDEELLARGEHEHLRLLAEIVDQVFALDRHRLDIFARVAVGAAWHAMLGAIVEEDALPVGLVLGLRFLLGLVLLLFRRGRLDFFLRLDELEERIAQELLFQMLLQVEQRHVEQIHRLIQARIDLELLPELRRLVETRLHEAATSPLSREKRSRSRAVSVGPR